MPPVPFAQLEGDFLRFVADIAYCTVTTVDRLGRPRSRIMHPLFEVVAGRPLGWAVTDRSPIKAAHLAANPHVACFYWSPGQNTVAIDAVATWAEDEASRRYAWDLFSKPPPAGWGDMSGYGRLGLSHPTFHVLRLDPWRVQILRADQVAVGEFTPRRWQLS